MIGRVSPLLVMILAGMGVAWGELPTTTFEITGIVVSSVDGTPIPRAHLSAMPARSGEARERQPFRMRSSGAVETDADNHGRFALMVPAAGRWRLLASAVGYVTQAYNAHGEFSSAVVLTPSERSFDLRFRLPPEAEITGTILDEAGEAVRNAHVQLEYRSAWSPDGQQGDFRNRMVAQTDDRGVYDFNGLFPGEYRVKVDAKPWYSSSAQTPVPAASTGQDPSLDVTYALTWYPGVNVPQEAEVLSLRPADVRRADFHLNPIPAVHVTLSVHESGGSGRRFPSFPVVERVDEGGAGMAAAIPNRVTDGRMDVGGLAPGIYRIRMAGPNEEPESKLIEVHAGDAGVIDASSIENDVANITIENDAPAGSRPPGVVLREVNNGTRFTSFSQDMFFRGALERLSGGPSQQPVTMQVPPGTYEVRLADRDSYLLAISAKGGEVAGRLLKVKGGDVALKLHIATGRASVHGVVFKDKKPLEGAMVLLVPAGLDDPGSFTTIVRDQANTDGSFDLNDVIPGQYILVAVANGWETTWNDAASLQHYLMQGIPLELHSGGRVSQDVSAQQP